MNTPESRSISDVIRDVVLDTRTLIKGELDLVRSEAGDKLNRVVMAVVVILGGTLLGFSALNILLAAIVQAMTHYMPAWLAAVIVGVVVAIIGLILVMSGKKALEADKLVPQRTADSLGKDANMVKGKVS